MFERKKDQSDTSASVSSVEDRHEGGGTLSRETARSAKETVRHTATVIGHSIHINGELHGEEDVRIEGDVTGTIKLINNSLTVGGEGKIHADVYAKSITVAGVMEGDLYGSERVNIEKNAQVRGNITAPRVSLEDGARFKGSIEMDPEAAEAAVGLQDAAESSSDTKERSKLTAKTNQINASKSNGDKPVQKPKTTSGKDREKRESVAG